MFEKQGMRETSKIKKSMRVLGSMVMGGWVGGFVFLTFLSYPDPYGAAM